ncbi:U-actitoxin-Aer2b-like [Actinia tenebrosa]|uniref:U-actitoxin-Aer2b-like n=1 Tax=Actinia tenebrosa TaxID=6105 RepID=A0A6P8HUK9_ACTTE|nr:U-actitoxin-Aer2b-like [Actinia tenebrosa]
MAGKIAIILVIFLAFAHHLAYGKSHFEKRGGTCRRITKCCGTEKEVCQNGVFSKWCCPLNWYLDCGFLGMGTCYCKYLNGKKEHGSKPNC